MVPEKSFLGYEESLFGKFQMVVCVTYCMLGLALLAMCMSLIQVTWQGAEMAEIVKIAILTHMAYG